MPSFCQVTATLTPTTDSLINVWVWMPTAKDAANFVCIDDDGTNNPVPVPEYLQ